MMEFAQVNSLVDVQERLDEVFWVVEEDNPSPWDDRLHLKGSGIDSREELEGALLALLGGEDLFLIHAYNEAAGTAVFSIYDAEP